MFRMLDGCYWLFDGSTKYTALTGAGLAKRLAQTSAELVLLVSSLSCVLIVFNAILLESVWYFCVTFLVRSYNLGFWLVKEPISSNFNFLEVPVSSLSLAHPLRKWQWKASIAGTYCIKWDDPEGGPETHDVTGPAFQAVSEVLGGLHKSPSILS